MMKSGPAVAVHIVFQHMIDDEVQPRGDLTTFSGCRELHTGRHYDKHK